MSDFDEGKHPRDEHGRFGTTWTRAGQLMNDEMTSKLTRSNHVYRGLTSDEFAAIKATGVVKSTRPHVTSKQGPNTFFAETIPQAQGRLQADSVRREEHAVADARVEG